MAGGCSQILLARALHLPEQFSSAMTQRARKPDEGTTQMFSRDAVSMVDAPEEVLHPGTRTLFRYWESIRGEDSAPRRRQLDLDRIRALVPSLFIFERSPVKGYLWRLAGTKLCQLWRRELTGMPVLSGW